MPWALDLPGPAEWSVQIVDIDTGAVLAARDEEGLLSSASVGKLFVLIELAHRLADDHSMVTSAFDQDPLAHDEDPFGPTVVNKTGTNLGVRADVGLVTANERTLAYAVIANWHEDPPGRGRAEVLSAMRALGSQVLEEIR